MRLEQTVERLIERDRLLIHPVAAVVEQDVHARDLLPHARPEVPVGLTADEDVRAVHVQPEACLYSHGLYSYGIQPMQPEACLEQPWRLAVVVEAVDLRP